MKKIGVWIKSRPKLIKALLAVIGLYLVLCLYALFSSIGTSSTAIHIETREDNADAKQLVVIVGSWRSNAEQLDDVADVVRGVKPGADMITINYGTRVFSNASPYSIAAQIEEKIAQLHTEKKYDEIVLCGNSMGALLVRKAYVYGCGEVSDAPGADAKKETTGKRKSWVKKVKRIVLLAGMNRGLSLDVRQGKQSYFSYYLNRLGVLVAKTTGTGKLMMEAVRGAPFVANLRMQWLDVMHEAKEKNLDYPVVVQLLGDIDDVVSDEDSRDVTVAKDFIFVPVSNTGHAEIKVLDDSPSGKERRRKISKAFGNDADLEELRANNKQIKVDQDESVTEVVFVLHGIRDLGEWTKSIEDQLMEDFKASGRPGKLVVVKSSYGYFGMGPFLVSRDRQKNVRWFMDEVTEIKAKYPNMKELHFIGHSNGTYILGSALERYVTLKVGYVVLAGSVLRRDYPWHEYTGGRVKKVRNYIGSHDAVVGLAPKVFEVPGFSWINDDLGSAGYDGFLKGTEQDRYVRGGHGAALVTANQQSISDFIIKGDKTVSAELQTQERPWWDVLTRLCWLLWLLAIGLVVAGGVYLPRLLSRKLAKKSSGWAEKEVAVKWYSRVGYGAFIWLILMTI